MTEIMPVPRNCILLFYDHRASAARFFQEEMMEGNWFVYILRCGDGSLYTGITTDVERRLAAHRSGKGAKYTRGRGPLEVAYKECCESHSAALKREWEIKQRTKEQKEQMIAGTAFRDASPENSDRR